MKNADAWIEELTVKIEDQKRKGRKSHYMMNEKMSHETATRIKNHFEKQNIDVELHRCNSCGGFDLIFYWKIN